MNIVIREAIPDDAEALIKHVKELTSEPDVCVSLTPEEFTYTVEEERKLLAQSIAADNSLFLLAFSHGELIGDLTCRPSSRLSAQKHVAVLGMSVRNSWRNKGIGSMLLEKAIEWTNKSETIKRIELKVFTINMPAIHLYKKYGFIQEGLLREAVFRYGKFHDELLMSLLLNNTNKAL
jgi:RimJ/RimL family protein N-acetyltransferase